SLSSTASFIWIIVPSNSSPLVRVKPNTTSSTNVKNPQNAQPSCLGVLSIKSLKQNTKQSLPRSKHKPQSCLLSQQMPSALGLPTLKNFATMTALLGLWANIKNFTELNHLKSTLSKPHSLYLLVSSSSVEKLLKSYGRVESTSWSKEWNRNYMESITRAQA